MAEVLVRADAVPHQLLELLHLREAAAFGARPDQLAADAHLEHPGIPGTSATSPSSAANVVSSSWAVQAARSSHLHLTQYVISTRGE